MTTECTLKEACSILASEILTKAKELHSVKRLPELFDNRVVITTQCDYGDYRFTIIDHPFDPSEVIMLSGYANGGALNYGLIYEHMTVEELCDDIFRIISNTIIDNDDFCLDVGMVTMNITDITGNDLRLEGEIERAMKDRDCIMRELIHPHYSQYYNDDELIALWILFGDVPIDDSDSICEEFIGFEVGTNRFEVWEWFDERYSGGVMKLIGDVERKCY